MSFVERLSLRVAVFAGGAFLMALEVAGFRIVGKTFGSALRETTAVIAVFLCAMSIGYWLGGKAGDRWPRASTLAATLAGAAATLLTVPWIDAWLSPIVASSRLALATHAFIVSTALFAVPTFLLAATSPIAVRLFTTSAGASGSTAGSISALSTVGSIAGSIATAFFLIDWLASITRTVLFVALGSAATAVLVVLCAGPQLSRFLRFTAAAAGAVAIVILTGAFLQSSGFDRKLIAPLPNTKLVFVGDSPYHRVAVRDRGHLRELQFNTAIQSSMQRTKPFGPGLDYTDSMHIAMLMRPEIRRILILGLGGGTAAKQYAHFYPQADIDVVEIDPLVVDVARRYFAFTPSERLRIHNEDARRFLQRSSGQWDLMIIDIASANRYGDTMPPHVVTLEFFREVATHLTERGLVHYHITFWKSALYPALHRTMSEVFPTVLLSRQGEVLASKVPLFVRPEELTARLAASPARDLPNLPTYIGALRSETPPRDALLLTDDYSPVDTLLRTRR